MEPPRQSDGDQNNDDDFFLDALDDFSFHDCHDAPQSDQPTSDSTVSTPSSDNPSPDISSSVSSSLRRRPVRRPGVSCVQSDESGSDLTPAHYAKKRVREKRCKLHRDLKENEKNLDSTESTRPSLNRVDPIEVVGGGDKKEEKDESTVTTANEEGPSNSVDSMAELGESSFTDLLLFMAGLVVRAVGFQLNLLVNFVKFPIWILYSSYIFLTDPFGSIRHCRGCLVRKLGSLWNLIRGSLNLDEHQTIWKLLLRFGWGLFWSIYVCTILCGLLVLSVGISGFFMSYLVEKPLQIKQDLNFDYAKSSPVAYVPVKSCDGVGCGVNCKERIGNLKSFRQRVIPPNHRLQVNVLLTLPESEYNRNLGMFQVRVEFLSADGKILSSKSYPCMLRFKSEPIRILLTFLKIAPLVAGYILESQTLELKIRGFTEGDVPTFCLRVTIEQRAEFRAGAGIPEIYDASLVLESELPLFKRILWCWRKTMFVWTSLLTFMMELMFILMCCRPLIIPKVRPRDGSAINNSNSNNAPEQS